MANGLFKIIKLLLDCIRNSGKHEGARIGEGKEAGAVTVRADARHITP